MTTPRDDRALMEVLGLDADAAQPSAPADFAADAQGLPALEARIEMYLRAVSGAPRDFTADERAAARVRILDAMAADMADATPAPEASRQDLAEQALPRDASARAAAVRPGRMRQAWGAGLASLREFLLAPLTAGAAFALRPRTVAVALAALLVVVAGGGGAWLYFPRESKTEIEALLQSLTRGVRVGAQNTLPGPKVALVIANATYADNRPLPEPIKDARAIADELRPDGFDVIVAEDLTKQKMRSAIDDLTAKIKPGSAALLFFSGYGIQSGNQSYLIPINAQIWDEHEIKRDGISVESILREMNAAGATVKVAIIDAARRNPFESRWSGHPTGLASLNAPRGTLAIYSAGTDMTTGDGSPFVSELLKEMRSPGLTAEQVFNRTRLDVSSATGNEQVPFVFSSLTENFYFADASARQPPPVTAEKPAETPAPAPTPVQITPAAPTPVEPTPAEPEKTAEELNKRGRTYAMNGDYGRADADFSEAIRKNARYAEALNNRCWTRAVMGQAQEALADCDEAVRLRVDYADAFDSRGLAHLKLGNFDRAIADFDAALRLRPKLASSLYGRGLAKLKKGRTADGNADIAAAKALDPHIARDYAHYGLE